MINNKKKRLNKKNNFFKKKYITIKSKKLILKWIIMEMKPISP